MTFLELPESALQAWRILFGQAVPVTAERFRELKTGDLKAAFRARALETHPDRALALGVDPGILHHRFQRTVWAYESLKPLIGAVLIGDVPPPTPRPQPASARQREEAKPPPPPKAAYSSADRTRARQHQKLRFYSGPLPSRPLRFGEYLFYQRIISWQDLISSLVWQRQQRPMVGEIALQWRLLTPFDLQVVIRSRRTGELFGECAVRTGFINPFWLRVILHRQGQLQPRLGAFFLSRGLVRTAELEQLLTAQAEHNRQPGRPAAKSGESRSGFGL